MDFMRAMLALRGSNKTTVKDMVELRKYMGEEFLVHCGWCFKQKRHVLWMFCGLTV